MKNFKKFINSNWTAFILGMLIIALVFIVAERDTVFNVITGTGTVLYCGLYALKAHFNN